MKLKNKILAAMAPLATISTIVPVALTSCSLQGDIFLQSNQSKTLELEEASSEYKTYDDSLFLCLQDKFAFPYEEYETHTFLMETENLKFSKEVKSGTFSLGFKSGGWTHDEQNKSRNFGTNFVVSGCVLEKGTKITFDLKVTYGTVDAATKKNFTKISNTCTFKGWTLTY